LRDQLGLFGVWAVASLEKQKNEHFRSYNPPIWGEKKPCSDLHKILHWGHIQDVITDANLGGARDRLSHFSVARGQILGFSTGFRSRPYNTLALPCECVIDILMRPNPDNQLRLDLYEQNKNEVAEVTLSGISFTISPTWTF